MKKIIISLLMVFLMSSIVFSIDIISFSGQVGDIPEPAFEGDTSDSSSSGSSSNSRSSSRRSSSSGKSVREEEIVYVGGSEEDEKPIEEVEVNVFKGKPPIQTINSIIPILAGMLMGLCLVISGLGVYIIKRKLNE